MDWRTPWSVDVGAGWTVDAFQIHLAAEYFARVGAHVVLQARPEPGQSTGDSIDYTVMDERAAVFNAGTGVRWIVSSDLSAFGRVVTNFSAAPDDVVDFSELQPVVSHTSQEMDFVLLGGGFSVHTRWADLTLGATWQASTQRTPRFLSFPTTDPAAPPDEATLK